MKQTIVPILLGGDLNAYGMATAFYEAGIFPSYALGRYRLGVSGHSRFVKQVIDRRMEHDEGRRALILETADHHPGARFVLLGCTDEYSAFLIRNAYRFDRRFIIPSPLERMLRYADKCCFIEEMKRREVPTPSTLVIEGEEAIPESVPFCYPAVLKPTNSEEYWNHPFRGMRKVWFPETRAEAEAIRQRIRKAGYRAPLLLQERIPVKDTDNYVLTVYCNRFAKVKAAVFGRVLLEEHTPRGLGNHAAILTGAPPTICKKLLGFLEEIGYCGFANFDLLFDKRRGGYLVLEMNLRQGRSNHYMLASGCNPASLILADRLDNEDPPCFVSHREVVWHSVPLSVVEAGIADKELRERVRALAATGRSVSALGQRADLRKNLWRRLFLLEHERRIRKRSARLLREGL